MRLAARVLPLRDSSLDVSVDVDVSVDAYVDVDGAVDIDRTFDVSVDSVHAQVKDEVKVHGAVNVNVNAHVKGGGPQRQDPCSDRSTAPLRIR